MSYVKAFMVVAAGFAVGAYLADHGIAQWARACSLAAAALWAHWGLQRYER